VFGEAGLGHLDVEKTGGVWPELGGYDTLVVVDTGTHSQLPGFGGVLEGFMGKGGRVLVMDHHKTQEPWGTARLVDAECSSACELVARTMRNWGVKLTREMGEALYVGLVSDTGWFQFSNTTPSTLRLAADLVELGVDADRIYKRLYLSEKESRLRLQARVLGRMELSEGGRVSVMTVRPEDFAETGAGLTDTENLINLPLGIETVEVSVLATDPPPVSGGKGGPEAIRVSLRSKGGVDVAKLAEVFGGGGHARAAGLKKVGRLEDVAREVREEAGRWVRGEGGE
jgi:phosphoesterase RecJ-like protein